MLKKKHRLTKEAFDQYFKCGKRFHGQQLQLIYAPTETFHGAAVVGKKVFKSAVKRNQMRRRLYGVLYRFSQNRDRTGVFILIAKPGAQTIPRLELLSQAASLLDQVR